MMLTPRIEYFRIFYKNVISTEGKAFSRKFWKIIAALAGNIPLESQILDNMKTGLI